MHTDKHRCMLAAHRLIHSTYRMDTVLQCLITRMCLCRYAELKRNMVAEELAQCTFSPKINKSSKRLAQSARRPASARGSPSVTPSPPKQSLQPANKASCVDKIRSCYVGQQFDDVRIDQFTHISMTTISKSMQHDLFLTRLTAPHSTCCTLTVTCAILLYSILSR